jgi:hypothetical protein
VKVRWLAGPGEVRVKVAVLDTAVFVGVEVRVEVAVGVRVKVAVNVRVDVAVKVRVTVRVGVRVGVNVDVVAAQVGKMRAVCAVRNETGTVKLKAPMLSTALEVQGMMPCQPLV